MSSRIRVAVTSLNQTPLDWSANLAHMQGALAQAVEQGAQLVVMPEMSVTGYGCEDAFLMEGVAQTALEQALRLAIPEDVAVVAGLPVEIKHRLYNGAAVLLRGRDGDNRIVAIYLKQNLAKNGIHYENRWFNPWPKGEVVTIEIGGGEVPVGDVVCNLSGIRLGFEICEDAWIADRPGVSLFERGVDIIINPSASHFAIGKQAIRRQFVIEGSRAFGAAYLYANLNGCESGRAIFDGGNMVASAGKLIARGPRLFYRPFSVTLADIDLWENRSVHRISSQVAAEYRPDSARAVIQWLAPEGEVDSKLPPSQRWQQSPCLDNEEAVRAIALGLHDWMRKTATAGFTLSLSGGADSALVACEAAIMVRLALAEYLSVPGAGLPPALVRFCRDQAMGPESLDSMARYITQQLLTCIYQQSANSSETTLNAAKSLAQGLGAKFVHWAIDTPIRFYTQQVEQTVGRRLDWNNPGDDISLQNIQARSRAPGVWMMANVEHKLLLTTGNLSESAVGYMTQDGDTAGVLAPVIGVRKTRIRQLLRWLNTSGQGIDTGIDRYVIASLAGVVNQQPTAELRPRAQTDEEDLMPFPVLDQIILENLILRRQPKHTYRALRRHFPEIPPKTLADHLFRYYQLFNRNQWKRDRSAPGFHIELDSLDPKTFARFPLLNGGFRHELDQLRQLLRDEQHGGSSSK
ncbi:NAD(+) synthase [Photobacterium rosenbergii]|uniref:Glutamine-dependent NAD(+) synthetase n=1 Tax=Photobacterium rosenbergii TaxID=294936 RepID=A0ABU3ZKP5_9GAMM|nr:NAD(+) synthase [Photobacterium rosenbergii]MDV5170702.1 NAD(+) synthase [Photobacterium rosenbergii]